MSPASHILPYQQPQGVAMYGEHMALTPGYLNMEVCDPRLPLQNETIALHSVVRCCRLVVHFLGLKSVKVTVLGWGDKWFRYSANQKKAILQPTYCCIRGAHNWMIKIDQMISNAFASCLPLWSLWSRNGLVEPTCSTQALHILQGLI